jgi:hypothetical protein
MPPGESYAEAWRAAAESGRFHALAERYAADAVHEGWLPGGLQRATGPSRIAAALARDFGPDSRLDSWQQWTDDGSFEVFFTRADGTRHSRYHLIRALDGLVTQHWTYPQGADVIGPGLSGSVIRRIEQPDGTVVVEKEISPSRDWIARATNDRRGREAALWVDGPLRDLPPCLDYPVIDVTPAGDGWTVRMRDVSESLFKDGTASLDEWRLVISCLHALHERHRGRPPEGLCAMGERLALFSERVARIEIDGADLLPKFSQHGWTLLRDLLPADVRPAFLALAARPDPLIQALESRPSTMIHGDANAGNLGTDRGRVIALDWGLVCRAPAEIEYTWTLGWTEDRDDVLEIVRATLGPRRDETTLQLAMLYNALFWFPNVAWLIETSQPDRSASARAELDWWIPHVRRGLAELGAR